MLYDLDEETTAILPRRRYQCYSEPLTRYRGDSHAGLIFRRARVQLLLLILLRCKHNNMSTMLERLKEKNRDRERKREREERRERREREEMRGGLERQWRFLPIQHIY